MILNSPTQSIRIQLSTVPAQPVSGSVYYSDVNQAANTIAPGFAALSLSDGEAHVFLPSPGPGIERSVRLLNIANPNPETVTASLWLVTAGTQTLLIRGRIIAGGFLSWTPGTSWTQNTLNSVPDELANLPGEVDAIRQETRNKLALPGGLVVEPTTAEKGAVIDVTVSMPSLTKNPAQQSLTVGQGASVPLPVEARSKLFNGVSASTVFHYVASNSLSTVEAQGTVTFLDRQYWGARGATPNAAQVRADLLSGLIAARGLGPVSVDARGGKRLYLALPKAFYTQAPEYVRLGGWPVAVAEYFNVSSVSPADAGAGQNPCWLLESKIVYDDVLEVSVA